MKGRKAVNIVRTGPTINPAQTTNPRAPQITNTTLWVLVIFSVFFKKVRRITYPKIIGTTANISVTRAIISGAIESAYNICVRVSKPDPRQSNPPRIPVHAGRCLNTCRRFQTISMIPMSIVRNNGAKSSTIFCPSHK